MRIVSMRTLQGPNVYLNEPIIIMELDLEELSERETREFPGFNDRLLQLLPGLHDHHCAFGRPGGLIKRLLGGTYFGHVIEHTALELAGLSGQDAHFGRTIDAGAPGVYSLIVEFEAEQAMRYLLTVAVKLAEALLRDEAFDIEPHLTEARRIIAVRNWAPARAPSWTRPSAAGYRYGG